MGRADTQNMILIGALAIVASGCAPPPGKQLVDGCYFASDKPVLKVHGNEATLLVPGNVKRVRVTPDSSAEQAGVTFKPGFAIVVGPPVIVRLNTQLASVSMMMKPLTDEPTIMAPTEPMGLIDLTKGPGC